MARNRNQFHFLPWNQNLITAGEKASCAHSSLHSYYQQSIFSSRGSQETWLLACFCQVRQWVVLFHYWLEWIKVTQHGTIFVKSLQSLLVISTRFPCKNSFLFSPVITKAISMVIHHLNQANGILALTHRDWV